MKLKSVKQVTEDINNINALELQRYDVVALVVFLKTKANLEQTIKFLLEFSSNYKFYSDKDFTTKKDTNITYILKNFKKESDILFNLVSIYLTQIKLKPVDISLVELLTLNNKINKKDGKSK